MSDAYSCRADFADGDGVPCKSESITNEGTSKHAQGTAPYEQKVP
jgi:hypothetical protein